MLFRLFISTNGNLYFRFMHRIRLVFEYVLVVWKECSIKIKTTINQVDLIDLKLLHICMYECKFLILNINSPDINQRFSAFIVILQCIVYVLYCIITINIDLNTIGILLMQQCCITNCLYFTPRNISQF